MKGVPRGKQVQKNQPPPKEKEDTKSSEVPPGDTSETYKQQLSLSVSNIVTISKQIEQRIQLLEEKEKHWAELEAQMKKHSSVAKSKITLDIGGKKFATAKSTLLKFEGSYFHTMLCSGHWEPDEDGSYFIDRNPKFFSFILDYIRTGKIDMEQLSASDKKKVLEEFGYYQIQLPEPEFEIEGNTLMKEEHLKKMKEWLGTNHSWKLIFKGSQHGFGNFRSYCVNKGPTLIVIRSNNGFLFGGYTSISWSSRNTGASDKDTFIFTLTNPHNIPPTQYKQRTTCQSCNALCNYCYSCNSQNAPGCCNNCHSFGCVSGCHRFSSIFDHSSYGPLFGNMTNTQINGIGFVVNDEEVAYQHHQKHNRIQNTQYIQIGTIDIQVSLACNSTQSNINFPSTFVDTTGKGANTFINTTMFVVGEIEVFAHAK